jgi:hypothetical protein
VFGILVVAVILFPPVSHISIWPLVSFYLPWLVVFRLLLLAFLIALILLGPVRFSLPRVLGFFLVYIRLVQWLGLLFEFRLHPGVWQTV